MATTDEKRARARELQRRRVAENRAIRERVRELRLRREQAAWIDRLLASEKRREARERLRQMREIAAAERAAALALLPPPSPHPRPTPTPRPRIVRPPRPHTLTLVPLILPASEAPRDWPRLLPRPAPGQDTT